ncbi:MAG: glycosyltransferase [Anaerolineae bacterium]|nr:glycosyltransferase [Anaerolineae bacterium]MCX8068627.1 glycosyltransferase [Anaerolineae bacterium]MDW7991609.1 glycosyltransferase [Anaerolineae bacterium]
MVGETLSGSQKPRISVVIPALNEAAYLPTLLEALAAQTYPADEIIVADAGSTDGTPEIARRYGARVVKGGSPAVGRNAGAQVATGDLILFLDADVVPPPDFIERAVAEFLQKGYDVATARMVPWDGNLMERIVHDAANLYFILMQSILPYAPGFCILVRRSLHGKIGGFNETLRMSEDVDYVRRAARFGRFGVLTSTSIPVSMRRFRRDGMLQVGMKYLWCEAQMLRGKPIREIPFKYEFGAFPPPSRMDRRPPRHRRSLPVSLSPEVLQRAIQKTLSRRFGDLLSDPLTVLEKFSPEKAGLSRLPSVLRRATKEPPARLKSLLRRPLRPGQPSPTEGPLASNGLPRRQ